MGVTFDPDKDARNRRDRGLSLAMVRDLVWSTALVTLSARQEITATRFVALGDIGSFVHVVVFVLESGGMRVISLRRANAKEDRRWRAAQIRS